MGVPRCLRHHDCCCNCKQEDRSKELVKDCVCVEWSVPSSNIQTIYKVGGFESLLATGFIRFDYGGADFITVKFFLNNKQIGSSLNIFKESSVAFNFTRFDQITVECSGGDPTHLCEGEICINSKYFV